MGSELPNPEKISTGADGEDPSDSGDTLHCLLCANIFHAVITLECGHNFCLECVWRFWDTDEDPHCPLCMRFSVNPVLREAVLETRGSNLLVNSMASVSGHSDTCFGASLDERDNPLTGTTDITGAEEPLLGNNRQEGGHAEVVVDAPSSQMTLHLMCRIASALYAVFLWIIRFYYSVQNTVLSILDPYTHFLCDVNMEETVQKEEQDTQGDPSSDMDDSVRADANIEETIQKEKEQDTMGDPCSENNDLARAGMSILKSCLHNYTEIRIYVPGGKFPEKVYQ
ncbi:uncharacterized protein LOC122814487 [Protopterus annectens]|uniref:uncharacterized protein LOC122814487 n=1 Tax=Protopterus annectens TaxID=7888 RepID=UPI001CFBC092|nr:uncharacterized protein LOC122814487 [Protopterus annectens]